MTKDEWYRQLFERLDNSKFRSSFHLKQKDIDYINEKGLDTIRQHAKDFIAKREAPAYIEMMANRHQCVDIQYLLPSTQQQHAAGSASESGIKCSPARD